MICNKCSGNNVFVTTEQNSQLNLSTGFSASSGLLFKLMSFPIAMFKLMFKLMLFPIFMLFPKFKSGSKSIGYTKVINSTVAICQDCGNKWKVK